MTSTPKAFANAVSSSWLPHEPPFSMCFKRFSNSLSMSSEETFGMTLLETKPPRFFRLDLRSPAVLMKLL